MKVRGIRGAITVKENKKQLISDATREMMTEIFEKNHILAEDIASIFFTMTNDLDAGFPAVTARDMGLHNVPLLCAREVPVKDSLPMCIRVLVHVNTDKEQKQIKHVYLRDAKTLRPDLK